jgi:hypothetical protein
MRSHNKHMDSPKPCPSFLIKREGSVHVENHLPILNIGMHENRATTGAIAGTLQEGLQRGAGGQSPPQLDCWGGIALPTKLNLHIILQSHAFGPRVHAKKYLWHKILQL